MSLTKQHRIAVIPRTSKAGLTLKQEERAEFKENDNISHFVCRLAYCRNEELRKWFLTQETRLFSLRLREVDPTIVKQMLEQKCGINYETVNPNDPDWKNFES